MVAELLSTSVETETKVADCDTGKGSSALRVWQDASTQASKRKMKSVSVTAHVKGKDKSNAGDYNIIKSYLNIIVHVTCSH